MTITGKKFTAVFLLFFLFAAPNTAEENKTPMIRSGNQSCPVSFPKEYSLLFETCNPHYNSENYYSTGLTHLSYIYYAFSFVYLILLKIWITICFKIRPCYRRIHFLMSGLLLMKAISLIYAAKERYYEKITGSRNPPDLLIFVHQCISSLRLFIVILLIGHGLPHVKPFLKKIDKIVLGIVIPLRILAEVASILVTGDLENSGDWNELIVMVDLMTPFYVIIPITSSILSIRGIDARVLFSRLELVRYFCVIVSVYLLALRAFTLNTINGNFKLNAIDDYFYLLKSNTAMEALSLVFYLVMFYLFKKYFWIAVFFRE